MRLRKYRGMDKIKDRAAIQPGLALQCRCDLDGFCRCIVIEKPREDTVGEERVGEERKGVSEG